MRYEFRHIRVRSTNEELFNSACTDLEKITSLRLIFVQYAKKHGIVWQRGEIIPYLKDVIYIRFCVLQPLVRDVIFTNLNYYMYYQS